MEVFLTEEGLTIVLGSEQYSVKLLHKCFYWYTRDYRVTIEPIADALTRVQLQPKEGAVFPLTLQDQVHNDLLDFKLRELITDETHKVRELLMAKAFAHYDTAQPLEENISDPVGFHPLGTRA
jgi:His-Xaa-Ser system protein HxsD